MKNSKIGEIYEVKMVNQSESAASMDKNPEEK